MKYFQYINFLVLTWAIQAGDTDVDSKEPIDFAVGGQAIIEGVMMRAPNNITMAVRKADGSIKVEKQHYNTLTQKYRWLNVPVLRGFINLIEMMVVGTKAINFSANESLEEEAPSDKPQTRLAKFGEALLFIGSMAVALLFSIGLFQALPLKLTTLLEGQFDSIENSYLLFNTIDSVIKVALFIAYIYILTLIPSFRRLFQYHGAEHKSIFTYENGEKLEAETAQKFTRFHPRCGTSFILIVFVIGIFVYTVLPRPENFWQFLALRVVFLPLISGLSYEALKFSAKHSDKLWVRLTTLPGLWFQRLTTKEPDLAQITVGLESLKASLAMEKEGRRG